MMWTSFIRGAAGVLGLFLLGGMTVSAQVEYLRLSPAQTIIQRVGATDVTVKFSRPQMRGRKIFGGLVPYGKMWRTGANENTTISFSHRAKIGDTDVAEGTYALFTKPGKKSWAVYLYTETDNLDVPSPLDSAKLIYCTTVASEATARAEESLVINFHDLTETTATLSVSWEKTRVDIPISFYSREAMEAAMNQEMKQNILDFSIAASYYQQRGIELEKAKNFQELAMKLRGQPNAWDYNSLGLILYKMGDTEQGVEMIKKSLQLAQESGNDYLIQENGRLLAEWEGGK